MDEKIEFSAVELLKLHTILTNPELLEVDKNKLLEKIKLMLSQQTGIPLSQL